MSYTPINWQTGDTITAEKLNKMDNGWSATPGGTTLLLEETVTTVGDGGFAFGELAYSGDITAPTIKVTFNGDEYICDWNNSIPGYGDNNFINYPFVIDQYEGVNELVTATAGTYTLKIETVTQPTIEVSTNFISAVVFHAVLEETTFQEVLDAMSAGRVVVVQDEGVMEFVCGTDTLDTPLKVFAIGANANGAFVSTYVASSVDDAIHMPF